MTKKHFSKRTFLISTLAILVCLAIFIGSTFAWFTDSVTSGNNVIQSGNLDLILELLEEDNQTWTDVEKMEEGNAIFDYELWEPGYTDVKILRVRNNGSLALKWVAKFISDYELSALADVIDVYVNPTVEATYPKNRVDLTTENGWQNVGTISEFVNTIEETTYGTLEAGKSANLGLALKMQESAGNEYQNMDLGGVFNIQIFATQYTFEEDSFDHLYDEQASYTATYNKAGEHEVDGSFLAGGSATDALIADGEGVIVNIRDGYYDAADQDCAVWAKNGATVNIYDGQFIADGLGKPATSAEHQDMIYAGANGGKINIYGGFFSARSEGAWLLNERDNDGEIKVYGGTFVNWNPADNVSESPAPHSFLADGCVVLAKEQTNGDIWYVVEKKEDIDDKGITVKSDEKATIEKATIKANVTGLENSGTVTLTDVEMEAGSAADYSNVTIGADASTTYNNVNIVSKGGGIGVAGGAKVVFNSGSVAVNTASTSGRYNFYVVGEGTEVTINGGEFSFSKTLNQKRAYICAGAGATVYVTGGTFGPASTRSGYTAGILGDGTVIITGGTFGFNPSAWVADGYEAVESDGTWTVSAK